MLLNNIPVTFQTYTNSGKLVEYVATFFIIILDTKAYELVPSLGTEYLSAC